MDTNWVQGISSLKLMSRHSQMGEETVIDYIFKSIGTTDKYYVDFGAWDGYYLSNVRSLIEQGWKGLMMDGDNRGNSEVKHEFITKENILELFQKYEVPTELDFLSIDIDGNDYWVLQELLTEYHPRVILSEFNGTIANGISKSIAYNPEHTWGENDYYGYSFEAGKKLAVDKGYVLVHQLHSTNLFFVREDIMGGQKDFGITYEPQQYHAHSPNREWVTV